MPDYLERIPDGQLLADWGIGVYGAVSDGLAAEVAVSCRRVHRRERKWLEQDAEREPPEPRDVVAALHIRRMRMDRR